MRNVHLVVRGAKLLRKLWRAKLHLNNVGKLILDVVRKEGRNYAPDLFLVICIRVST